MDKRELFQSKDEAPEEETVPEVDMAELQAQVQDLEERVKHLEDEAGITEDAARRGVPATEGGEVNE